MGLFSIQRNILLNMRFCFEIIYAEKIEKNYSNGIRNVMELEERNCLVLFGVDVKQMSDHFFLKTQRFNRIVYNFPHVGFHYPEDNCCQIQLSPSHTSLLFVAFIFFGY